MTREQLKRYWKIIKAYKNGEDIEYQHYSGEWRIALVPSFDADRNYRVKPKTHEFQIIPLDFSDAENLVGKLIKSKFRNCVSLVSKADKHLVYTPDNHYSYEWVFTYFTFLDGKPCGKIKEICEVCHNPNCSIGPHGDGSCKKGQIGKQKDCHIKDSNIDFSASCENH